MGYEMPIVCKDVYLPYVDEGTITKENYKKTTGVDLDDVFEYSETDGCVVVKNHCKLYLVTPAYLKGVYPALAFINNGFLEIRFGWPDVDEVHVAINAENNKIVSITLTTL